jgi:DNA-directed RNA polymerase specialized sigma24 family protein
VDTTPSTHGPLRERIRAGDHDAFGELFDAYARSVYNHAYRLTAAVLERTVVDKRGLRP